MTSGPDTGSNYSNSRCYRGASRGDSIATSIDIGVGSNLMWQVYTVTIASDMNIFKY